MNRTVTVSINGQERTLNYSIEIMFEMAEKYGNINKALEAMAKDSKEGFEAVRWFALKMANDGELLRRDQGFDKTPLLTEKDVSSRMHPLEYSSLRDAVIDAIVLGYQRDFKPESEEIDLGLMELNAKKTQAGN